MVPAFVENKLVPLPELPLVCGSAYESCEGVVSS